MQFTIHLLASDRNNQLIAFNNLASESKNLTELELCAVDKSIAYELRILKSSAHLEIRATGAAARFQHRSQESQHRP
jgi:hypothetical protein